VFLPLKNYIPREINIKAVRFQGKLEILEVRHQEVPITLEWFSPVQNALLDATFGLVSPFCYRPPRPRWLSRT